MATIIKQLQNRDVLVDHKLEVLEIGERGDGRILSLEVDDFDNFTPDELITFGVWLVEKGVQVQKEFNKNDEAV